MYHRDISLLDIFCEKLMVFIAIFVGPVVRQAGGPLRHKPTHKAKTYVEQLRELQKPAIVKPHSKQGITEAVLFIKCDCV